MRFVETDHMICFNESHGLFGTRLRYVEAPYWAPRCRETQVSRTAVRLMVSSSWLIITSMLILEHTQNINANKLFITEEDLLH